VKLENVAAQLARSYLMRNDLEAKDSGLSSFTVAGTISEIDAR